MSDIDRKPLLSVRNLSVVFRTDAGTVHAVNDVSFDLTEGETLGVVGESGSGKSVTMQAVMGLLRAPPARIASGKVLFRGQDLLAMAEHQKRRMRWRDIAMVFQDPMTTLNPVLPIGLQLAEALVEHEGVRRQDAEDKARAMLELVGIANPAMRLRAYPHQLSGGQVQRVGIAMALMCNPALLIADEPTTALDVTIQAQVVELVVRLKRQLGMSMIWITHDLALVAGLADRIAVMYGGTIVEEASTAELFANPIHPYTRGLLGSIPAHASVGSRLIGIPGSPPSIMRPPTSCAFSPRCAHATDDCRSTLPVLQTVAPGHRAACLHWKALTAEQSSTPPSQRGVKQSAAPAKPLLSVRDLTVYFPIRRGILKRQVGSVRAVDGVSFTVMEGETLALVGESGCGKSTTGRAILGLTPITSGEVIFDGVDPKAPAAELRAQRTRIAQMVFQNPYASLNPRLTVGRIISEGLRAQKLGDRTAQEKRARELLDMVGLPQRFLSRYPFELSGGQRQRVGIARALATNPRFIVADEPISALDVSIQAQVINLMDDLKRRLGLTYLFVSHDLAMIRHISDRVVVMYLGRIVEIGRTSAVFGAPAHPYTQALLSAVPTLDPVTRRERIVLGGQPPDPSRPPPGCSFHPRCPVAKDICRSVAPALRALGGSGDHTAACHFPAILPARADSIHMEP